MADYDLGAMVDFVGIEGGIENTNYFVTTEQAGSRRQWVLTLFEELGIKDMPYFSRLTTHLEQSGLPVPAPLRDREKRAMKVLAERPALLLPRFPGTQISQPQVSHCQQVGALLGRIHVAARRFPLMREAHRGKRWWEAEAPRVAAHLDAEDAELLLNQVEDYKCIPQQGWQLPQGTIHGDLFVDNVLFVEGDAVARDTGVKEDAGVKEKVSAVIDFYNACTGYQLFDLAIAVNDWCVDGEGRLVPELTHAFVSAYASERPFSADEYAAWPLMLQTAAMRFWLSRLITYHRLEEQLYDAERVVKDPEPYRRILLNHRRSPATLIADRT